MQVVVPEDPTATAPPLTPAMRDRVATLLGAWAVRDPVPVAEQDRIPLGATADGAHAAFKVQHAPVITAATGVRLAPTLLLADGAGQPQHLVAAVAAGDDLLAPAGVVWANNGAAVALLFAWQVAGQQVDAQPLLLLDAAGNRRGPVLWTLGNADLPVWAPGGHNMAYLDAAGADPQITVVDAAGGLRVSGPAANHECSRCWPEVQWAPAGDRLAYATRAPLPTTPATPATSLGRLTWRLVVLDATTGTMLLDQQGTMAEEAHVLDWADPSHAQVVLRRPLIPGDQITGAAVQWQDTPYVLRLD
ncbi:MAG TPA: hypothetical protein VM536_05775, partial [Chloroflexia bacterium]|nr:hypothetical protein [Chloroflexia bacterium]